MSDSTIRHKLPLLAAAQAQKHVTHNEALLLIDALLNLRLTSRGGNTPPASPLAGESHVVGAVPAGAWAFQPGKLAVWSGGGWVFHEPQAGWIASTGTPPRLEVFDGAVWREAAANVTSLGVNAVADAGNPVVFRANNMLATALEQGAGGDGDLRLKLNREGPANTASLLFQSGFSGRAEMGLAGTDEFAVKVSENGSVWRDAIRIAPANGMVSFPSGADFAAMPNLVINGDFAINQRGFAGGSLSGGSYGFDRWRAASAASLSMSGGTVTLASGAISQTLEAAAFGLSAFPAASYTVSVEAMSGAALGVSLGGSAGQIVAAAGRRSITLTPSAANPTMTLTLSAGSGGSSFGRVMVEEGRGSQQWSPRPAALEAALCARYFWAPGHDVLVDAYQAPGGYGHLALPLPVRMRQLPSVGFAVTAHDNVALSERLIYCPSPQMAIAQVRATTLGRCHATYSAITFTSEY